MKTPIRVAITGAAGQIGYSLLFRIASGSLFGPDQPVSLNLIEIPQGMSALEGVVMELHDCAFPLLRDIVMTSDLATGFNSVNWALLVGSVPRKAGMERKDLLDINGKIFVAQGRAIQEHAANDIRVLVVGNPCNTNALIALKNAPDVPRDRFFAMTRLDENRAKAQLAMKSGYMVKDVSCMAIWGNHSSTQYPNFFDAKIVGKPAIEILSGEREWLEGDFIRDVQQRGAAIIKARGASSAASAANAAIDTVRSLVEESRAGDFCSVGVYGGEEGEYGVGRDLIFSYPIRSLGGGKWEVVKGLSVNEFSRERIRITEEELLSERSLVEHLFP